jgi:hypothetical protein
MRAARTIEVPLAATHARTEIADSSATETPAINDSITAPKSRTGPS